MNNDYFFYEDKSDVQPKNSRGKTKTVPVGCLVCVGVAAVILCVFSAVIATIVSTNKIEEAKGEDVVIYTSSETHPQGSTIGTSLSVAEIAATVSSSVVEISTETVYYSTIVSKYVTSGAGSGVIVAECGYIITNLHVIDGADTISIRLADGTECSASVVGSDIKTDIAVVKIDGECKGLTPIVFGDSDDLVAGSEVVAIGNPLGKLGGTVTNGIISAKEREITVESITMTLMQTNAAVSPGNSGGGLFNAYGELVGIVNAKSVDDGVEGIGFAIPANTAKSVAAQIIENGFVSGRADYNDLKLLEVGNSGLYYKRPGIYAREDNGDIKVNDYIMSVNGESLATVTQWKLYIINNCKPGDVLQLVVNRNGREQSVSYTVKESAK